ncbi:hypothetical protein ACWFRM_18700 [Streptomyces sp. NPDC055144]
MNDTPDVQAVQDEREVPGERHDSGVFDAHAQSEVSDEVAVSAVHPWTRSCRRAGCWSAASWRSA